MTAVRDAAFARFNEIAVVVSGYHGDTNEPQTAVLSISFELCSVYTSKHQHFV